MNTTWLIALVDQGLCQAISSSLWTQITSKLFRWIALSPWVIPVAIALLGTSFLVGQKRRWRYPLRLASGLMILGYVVLGTPQLAGLPHQALVQALPQPADVSSDVIVVLGRGTDMQPQRVKTAAQLWQAGQAPLIFVSGRGDAGPMVRSLQRDYHIPAASVDGEPCSRTTEENAQLTATLLQSMGAHRITLVTDYPHLVRSYLTFKSLGFEVIPQATALPTSLDRRHAALLMVREYLGLVTYGLMGRYQPRQASVDGLLRLS